MPATSQDLLTGGDLPDGFSYPPEFVRLVEYGLTDLEPWWIMTGDLLRERHTGLAERRPGRSLVPFAERQDNDDVACCDLATGTIAVVHDYGDPKARDVARFADFPAWLHQAMVDFLEFN
ncbi:hypothetical protein BCD48_43385 [Pseudofrankia sp. BMG5.36]|nr:hypothetical protein BCD48_43385 [Pseudofrankia sp. BMG5.36]